jgi:hypothetical protein
MTFDLARRADERFKATMMTTPLAPPAEFG